MVYKKDVEDLNLDNWTAAAAEGYKAKRSGDEGNSNCEESSENKECAEDSSEESSEYEECAEELGD